MNTRRLSLVFLVALTAIGPLTGCVGSGQGRIQLELPEDAERIAVDIENFRGSVTLREWGSPRGRTVVVRSDLAFWKLDPALREPVARGLELDAEVIREPGGEVVRIRSSSAFPEQEDHHVNLSITTPRLDGVSIRTARGPVFVHATTAAVTVDTLDGDVEVRLDEPIDQPLTITTGAGDITAHLHEASSLAVDALTLDGRVELDQENATLTGFRASTGRGRTLVNVPQDGVADAEVVLRSGEGVIELWFD
ncbi:MAG: DUF4097 family beta strand repeat-containing protein [Planctomycetota bacterium]